MDPIDALLAYAATPPGRIADTDLEAFAEPVFADLLRLARNLPPEDQNDILRRVGPAIAGAAPYEAARIALVCGTIVEWGADPGVVGALVVERLNRALADTEHPERERILRFLALATMAMACRDVQVRAQARRIPGFTDALAAAEDEVGELGFVLQLMRLVDDLVLVVLHPERHEGARVRLVALSTICHLITLLQAGFPEWCTGEPVDPHVTAIATGEVPYREPVTDHARLHLFDWTGLDGHPGATLWSDASPAGIPALDGERVVLVTRPLFGGRSWDGGMFANFHDALRSRVAIEARLTPAEVDAWLDRIRAAPSVTGS